MRQVVNASKPFGLGSLNVGYVGENNVTEIAFDFTDWYEEYGDGSLVLKVKRFRDDTAYPVVLDIEDGHIAVWTITSTDLQNKGVGKAQLQYMVDEVVKKSMVFDFTVENSLASTEEVPDPYKDWMDNMIRLAEEASGYVNDASRYADSASGYADNAERQAELASDYAEESKSYRVPSDVRGAIFTLLENAAYATTGLEDEIAIVEAWAEEVISLTLSVSTLSLNNDVPQVIAATTIPAGSTVTWVSSDDSVATVVDGIVTGVGNGSCVITAYAGDLEATCDVTVAGFVELESISVIYTQSGTVYDTDSLDVLKADLVVTATYDDSSSETIPSTDYTLSGTLTEGTSTIYVVYGGKTTTFTVTVTEHNHHIFLGGYSLATPSGASNMKIYKDTNNARAAGVYDAGDHPYPKDSGASALVGDYYPIPIPQGKTSMIVTMPSALYVGMRAMHWDGSNYISDYSSSWTASNASTFSVSSYNDGTYFAGLTFKVGTAGTTDMRNYDMSDVFISFS